MTATTAEGTHAGAAAGDGAGVEERLAKALGWFSAGLGIPQVLAPGRVARLIGVKDDPTSTAVMRAVGVRELAAAGGILRRERPAGWLWARVAGDAMDLALIGLGAVGNPKARKRAAAAAAAVVGVTVLDTITSARLSTDRAGSPGSGSGNGSGEAVRTTSAITINKPIEEVRAAWTTGDIDGTPEFTEAPGGRGTEVRVVLEYTPPGGAVGAVALKLTGEEPSQQLKDGLRRFKQVLETGEVVVSNGSPEGTRSQNQWSQEEARP